MQELAPRLASFVVAVNPVVAVHGLPTDCRPACARGCCAAPTSSACEGIFGPRARRHADQRPVPAGHRLLRVLLRRDGWPRRVHRTVVTTGRCTGLVAESSGRPGGDVHLSRCPHAVLVGEGYVGPRCTDHCEVCRQGAWLSARVSSINWHHVKAAFTARCACRALSPVRGPATPCPVP